MWDMAANMARAVVFVVDSTDRARMARTADSPPLQPDSFVANYMSRSAEQRAEIFARLRADMTAKETLHTLMQQYSVQHKPVLVLATKQDQPGAMAPGEIAELLGLPSLVGVDWRLSGCNALTGEGISEAMHWLTHVVNVPTDFTAERNAEHAKQRALWAAEKVAHDNKNKLKNDTSAITAKQQSNDTLPKQLAPRVVRSASEPRAPTPTQTATPPSETNDDLALIAVNTESEDGRLEGQPPSNSDTPTPNETSGEAPVELVVSNADRVESAAAVDESPATGLHPFDSLSSTYLALPPLLSPQPEPVELVRRKKHWYSRKKYVATPSRLNPFERYQKYQHLVV
jgi:hypothetical protein